MAAREGHIHPAAEEGSHLAVEAVLVAIGEGHLEEDPIRLAVVADHPAEDPIHPAVADHPVEGPILRVEAEDLLEERPSSRAVEGVEDPNCPAAEGIAGRNHPGFVADSHLRREVAEGDRRMTCLAV